MFFGHLVRIATANLHNTDCPSIPLWKSGVEGLIIAKTKRAKVGDTTANLVHKIKAI